MLTCRQPDRDCPKLLCGHPLPCPSHTATIDLTADPPSLIIPITANAALQTRRRLADIASILKQGIKDTLMPAHTPSERKKNKKRSRKSKTQIKRGGKKK